MALAPRRVISRREWAAALVIAGLIMGATTLPYLAALQAQTAEWRFGGFLWAVEDGNSYLAKMGLGARGEWLFRLLYSSEPQRGVFMFGLHLLLGRLAGPDHGALAAAYHAARIVFGVGLLLASYAFLAAFLPEPRQRRLGLVLVALGGGLGWLLTLLGRGDWLGSLPVDFYSPEAYTFLILFGLPHLALSRVLFLLGLLCYLRGQGLLAGLALLGVSLIQPLYVPVAWLVIGADLAWQFAEQRRLPLAGLRQALVLGLVSAPVLLYTIYVFSVDPVLRQWNAQNQLPSPHPLHYVLGLGPWLALAVPGWRWLWRCNRRLARFAAGWLLLVPVLLYLPVPTQRRLIEGVQLPLAALAVLGLTQVLQAQRRWLLPLALLVMLPTYLILWAGSLAVARQPDEPVFHRAGELAAFAWLRDNARPGEVALSTYDTGNRLPAYTPLVAYIGHGPETIYLSDKQPRVAAFYEAATPDSVRQDLLAEAGIRYVFFGPAERALGGFDPRLAPYLASRYAAGEYAVYEVVGP